ncbi:Imm65 family immunity protein [Bacteroides acidifaciens]|uniref:Imm65 family immunity protein n=1 Tax=Bacteroides acidifaciens TaxID=85831 RepID=UPI00158C0246|nr:Imm65 family immunity protein [Bacteroides acidifaciens]
MKRLVYIVIFILFWGCMSPSLPLEEVHQRVTKQIELLIDSGYLTMPYIEINEIVSNDSNVVYRIGCSDSPASLDAELPSRVMKYKERFLCFIELDEPEMSRTELFRQGVVADSAFRENLYLGDTCYWLLACRKYEEKQTLVRIDVPQIIGLSDFPYKTIFDYPELWPYFSGGKPYGKSSLMVLNSHDIIVSKPYIPELYSLDIDSLKQYIDRFSGEIFLRNLTDSSLTFSSDSTIKMHYAVVNGVDTLNLYLRDSLPIVVKAHGYKILKYESEHPHSFLQKLPEQNIWMSMYKLFSDSTFCFLSIDGMSQNSEIMHNDTQWGSYMKGSLSTGNRLFFNKNIDDKEARGLRFIGG